MKKLDSRHEYGAHDSVGFSTSILVICCISGCRPQCEVSLDETESHGHVLAQYNIARPSFFSVLCDGFYVCEGFASPVSNTTQSMLGQAEVSISLKPAAQKIFRQQ